MVLKNLFEILDLGYLPSVNDFQDINQSQDEQLFFPSKLFQCKIVKLVQLSCIVDKEVLFQVVIHIQVQLQKISKREF